MNRRFLVVAAFAIWVQCSAVFALEVGDIPREPGTEAIEVAESTPLGKPIVAKVDLDEGERVIWKSDAGASLIKADKCRAYIWATPGAHVVEAVLIPAGDGEPFWLKAGYSVGGAPPTPPVVVKTLAELAGKDAATFAEIVTDGRSGLAKFTTVAKFHEYLALAYDFAKIPADHPAALEIKSRIDAAASGTLTDASRKSLDVALAKVVTDLGAKPPVPPVTEGKRLVVIVADLKDTTPERAAMFNNLRTGTEAQYLSSKGHQLLILDEAQETADGTPDPFVAKLKAMGEALPAEFVLDLQTKAVIAKQALPSTSAAVVDFVKGNGG